MSFCSDPSYNYFKSYLLCSRPTKTYYETKHYLLSNPVDEKNQPSFMLRVRKQSQFKHLKMLNQTGVNVGNEKVLKSCLAWRGKSGGLVGSWYK